MARIQRKKSQQLPHKDEPQEDADVEVAVDPPEAPFFKSLFFRLAGPPEVMGVSPSFSLGGKNMMADLFI